MTSNSAIRKLVSTVALLVSVGILASLSSAQFSPADVCYGGCEYSSIHRFDKCLFFDGMGGATGADNADQRAIESGLTEACGQYASAHSDRDKTTTNGACVPILGVDWIRSGGPAASFAIEGSFKVVHHPGGGPVTYIEFLNGKWWLGSCTCNDARNINNAKVGVTGQCHCPPGMQYSELLGACLRYVDRYHDADTCTPKFGNPVAALTGAKQQSIELLPMLGEPLRLAYDSSSRLPANRPEAILQVFGAMSAGPLWTTNMHRSLVIRSGGATGSVLANRGSGRWVTFVEPATGSGYLPTDPSVRDELRRGPAALPWRYVDGQSGSVESYDAAGRLATIDFAQGGRLVFEYSSGATPTAVAPQPGLLIGVQDHQGRRITMTYVALAGAGSPAALATVTGADGAVITLGYHSGANLGEIRWPDGSTTRLLYENPAFGWALTGMIDESGNRVGTYAYDGEGRAVTSESVGGVSRFALQWVTPPAWQIVETLDRDRDIIWRDHYRATPEGTTVTLPRGDVITLEAAAVLGAPRLSSQSQPAGSGCATSVKRQGHDGSGNVIVRDDFNGTRTCYGYDGIRSLETHRVEGLSSAVNCADVAAPGSSLPPAARRISSQWHPDRRLRVRSAEPGRLVTSVYNGQPDPFAGGAVAVCAPAEAVLPDGKPLPLLCRQVEQETGDPTGALGFGAPLGTTPNRAFVYSYDASGRRLMQQDPNGGVTRYAYHPSSTADVTAGDLATITNAAGHVTRFLRYDRSGRPLLEISPNGRETEYRYDARGRLVQTSVGGAVTTYTYLPNGRLSRVMQPDGGWLRFDHDAAQRLVAVSNAQGHRIEYTLDASGNRIGETVRDDGGALRRSLSRSVDALDRVYQVNGRP